MDNDSPPLPPARGIDRIPPHNLQAEMALLGCIMVDKKLFEAVSEHVAPADFYAHVHETIFAVMTELYDARAPIDKISVANALAERGALEKVGGVSYLSSLMDTVQTAASAKYYARIVADDAALRRLISIGSRTASEAYEGEYEGPLEVANRAISAIEVTVMQRAPNQGSTGLETARLLTEDWTREGTRALLTPWSTMNGPYSLDGGFLPREFVVWGGNPGQGKTAAAMNLCDFVARRYGDDLGNAAYFPLEMGRTQTSYRFASLYTGLSSKRIQTNRLDGTERELVRAGIEMLGELPMTIYEKRPTLDMATIRLLLKKQKREHGLSGVWIDHVGLMKEVQESDNVHRAQTRVMEQCLDLCDELETTVHLLMHIARIPRDKDGHVPRPTMYDLRGGGNPEGYAHTVIIVWRPQPKGTEEEKREGFFLVEKARAGGEGTVPLKFFGERTMWTEDETMLWFPTPQQHRESRQQGLRMPYKDDEPELPPPPPDPPPAADDEDEDPFFRDNF